MTNYLITHDDIDGAGCSILFARYCKRYNLKYKIINTVPADVDKIILDLIENCRSDIESLLIADISPSSDKHVLEELSKLHKDLKMQGKKLFNGVMLIDHHETAAARLINNPAADFEKEFTCEKHCATYALCRHLFLLVENKEFEFAEIVNDYDLFILKDKRSIEFNAYMYFIGLQNFIDERVAAENPAFMTEQQQFIVEKVMEENNTYIDDKVATAIVVRLRVNNSDKTTAIIFADRLQSLMAKKMRTMKEFDDCEVLAVIDLSLKAVSLRSLGEETVNVGELAKLYSVRGGGHAKSGGFSVSGDMDNILKEIFHTI